MRTYIFPCGSWSPNRFTGMLTFIAVTSNVLVTPMPARHAAVREVGAAAALGTPAASWPIGHGDRDQRRAAEQCGSRHRADAETGHGVEQQGGRDEGHEQHERVAHQAEHREQARARLRAGHRLLHLVSGGEGDGRDRRGDERGVESGRRVRRS